MAIKSTNLFIFLVVSILLLSFNSNPSAAVQLIPMQQIGEDSTGDGSWGFDIVSAYAGSFDELLMLTVVYAEPAGPDLYSNTTIRNANGDLFLIMAASGEFNNFVFLTGATSLEDDSKNMDEGGIVLYEETWRVHANYTELTFFVDWMDIGGEGPIDIVFWTGRPMDNPDKLPNTGHLSFDSVETVDTTGYLDDPTITTTTIYEEPNSGELGSPTTISVTEDNGDDGSNQTVTPDTQEEIQLTDLIPLSNTFALGLVIMYLGYRKSQR